MTPCSIYSNLHYPSSCVSPAISKTQMRLAGGRSTFAVCFKSVHKVQHFKDQNGCERQNHHTSQAQWSSWVINIPNLYAKKENLHHWAS